MINEELLPVTSWTEALQFFGRYARTSRLSSDERLTQAERLARTKAFFAELRNPQDALRVIHVAGTTGKGSTCTYIDALLRAHEFKAGLCLSPHAIDIRERFQLNGELVSEERAVQLLNEVIAVLSELQKKGGSLPGYGELLRGMAFLLFAQERVDYAVVETGIGGRFDSSNVATRSDKVCVITKLGLDHVKTLGETIEKIADQKIGIVHRGNWVVIGRQSLIKAKTLATTAAEAGAEKITCVEDGEYSSQAVAFRENMLVPYLRENAELAHVVCQQIATRDGWTYRSALVQEAVSRARLPLRFEIIHWKHKRLILDAAHNPQKMQGLADAMKEAFPDQLYAVACAFNPGTDVAGTAMPLLPSASKVACVDFVAGEEAYQFRFLNPVEAAECIVKKVATKTVPIILNEWPEVLAWIEALPEKLIVLTGSFHFVADARTKLLKQEG